jgi:hypothetical protein
MAQFERLVEEDRPSGLDGGDGPVRTAKLRLGVGRALGQSLDGA